MSSHEFTDRLFFGLILRCTKCGLDYNQGEEYSTEECSGVMRGEPDCPYIHYRKHGACGKCGWVKA